jgi:uridine kinase
MKQPYIVGITGGSGSGKTFFLNALMSRFNQDEICLISQDNYYRPLHEQQLDENGVHNFDIPESIDSHLYARHILALREGKSIQLLEYTFNNPDIIPKLLTFNPAPIIVVEGIFVFYVEEIARLLDLKIFIDTKEHLKIKRRILRDNVERGYDLNDVIYRYEYHAAPSYEKYIEPFKSISDLVIPNNHKSDTALDVLTTFLKTKL